LLLADFADIIIPDLPLAGRAICPWVLDSGLDSC
jgi:hypothetical protein